MSEELLTHQFFTPLIGQAFTLANARTADGAPIALALEVVTPILPPRRLEAGEAISVTDGPARQEPFSLRFRGPRDIPLPQATYRLLVETAAAPLDIFIVPIGREPTGFIYEAIFG